MGYGPQFSANQLGKELKLWGKRGYGLKQVWVKTGSTVDQSSEEELDGIFKKIK